jgi:putative lipoprotein
MPKSRYIGIKGDNRQIEGIPTILKGTVAVNQKWWLTLLLLVVGIVLSACRVSGNGEPGNGDAGALGVISGSVAYRERIAMPADAVIRVQLLDISKQDAPASVIAEQRIRPSREVPIPFTVQYDRSKINRGGIYSIAASIEVDGEIVWRTTTAQLVITNGNPTENIEIVVAQTR